MLHRRFHRRLPYLLLPNHLRHLHLNKATHCLERPLYPR
jgi:hypothetical protein